MNQFVQIPNLKLHDGQHIPALGFGTYSLNGHAGVEVMQRALGHGYRMLDSAFNYENEGAVGQAIRLSKLERDELFITSKFCQGAIIIMKRLWSQLRNLFIVPN